MRLISRTVGRDTMEEGSAEKGHVTVVYPAYPNGAQERELLRTLDVVRGLYNHFLAECIADVVEGDMFPTPMEMNKGITVMRGQDAGLRSVAVFTLRDAPLRVHAAMTRFASCLRCLGSCASPASSPNPDTAPWHSIRRV